MKPPKRSEPGDFAPEFDDETSGVADEEPFADLVRVICPDCARPVALADPGEAMPQHALCSTPWNPFGLTLCPGSGRVVAGDKAAVVPAAPAGRESVSLAALPEGLDWRLQPFSHVTTTAATTLRQAA
ncbi:hypothetical protein [Streptomyces litchfieldiae]|uniref:hypothetical protein n=1 Tax=Streptomyces litchfieldiae TaxID=3075543 RepID=UPI00288B8430|nr:hypothetical protein [Streptomyces sp. DSM 44938]